MTMPSHFWFQVAILIVLFSGIGWMRRGVTTPALTAIIYWLITFGVKM